MDHAWYQNAVFYGVDIRRFKDSNGDGVGDLKGLMDSMDYLADLGVDALWLLPFYETPLLDNGYDVSDYYRVDPRVGTLADFTRLVEVAKERHIHLMLDLVLNHTSDQHPWFQAARRDPQSSFRDYYVWSESPPLVPDQEEPVFPGEENTVWTFDPLAQSYYFHRFYAFQPDLQTANPIVQQEILRIVDFWLSFGVSGFRLDSAPLLIHEKGLASTQMEHPHWLLRQIHDFSLKRLPDAVLLAEANLPLNILSKYFGGGKEMTMLMNFMASAHIFLALARHSAEPIRDLLKGNLDTPANGQWLNFLRNLDELTLNRLPAEQRDTVMQAFAPQANMQIYQRGIRRRVAPMLEDDRRKMALAFSLLFSLPGNPLIMYGDELGMGDDLSLPGRNAVRNPMQWTKGRNAGFSSADRLIAPIISEGRFSYQRVNVEDEQRDAASFLNCVKQLISIRKKSPEIGLEQVKIVEILEKNPQILAHRYPPILKDQLNHPILFVHNLGEEPVQITFQSRDQPPEDVSVLAGNGRLLRGQDGKITLDLPPYGYFWLR